MRSFAVLSLGIFAIATAQVTSNYEQQFTSLTNSYGVVTGQPTPVTSQPAPVTSQPGVYTSAPYASSSAPYAGSNSTMYMPTGASKSTVVVYPTGGSPTGGSGSGGSGGGMPGQSGAPGSSGTVPNTPSQSPNAAAGLGAAHGGTILGLGALLAALL